MGYRNYIAYIPKKEYDKIKYFNKQDLYKYKKQDIEDGYVGVYDVAYNSLYELGKYVEFGDKKYYSPVFLNNELQEYFENEHDFYIVKKEFLEMIINNYKEKIKKYYNKMINPFFGNKNSFIEKEKCSNFLNSIKTTDYRSDGENDVDFDFTKITQDEKNALWSMIEHIKSMRNEWVLLNPFRLEKGIEITTSWKYEYGIFELVRIYKYFDWDNNIMIYYGY
jgi:hypothetical protein